MKRIGLTICVGALIALAAIAAPAQTCSVAQLTSPVPGSTLVADPATGAIDFTWCNASADYFVIVESVLGAHDIFFAFTGGAGGGAGQNFLNLGPGCAPAPPTGCIPALGETIYFTLETVKNKQILGSFQYTFTAPSPAPAPPADTSITVDSASASSSSADQNVMLTAAVTAASTVNQGTVSFQVKSGTTNVGSAVTSAPLSNGSASVIYLVPGGTAPNSYTIQASYSGGANFKPTSGTGTLTVNQPAPSPATTTTTVDPQSVTVSSAIQNVTLTATVSVPGAVSTVNEGTVEFTVMDGVANVVVPSATLSNGSASVIYALPAGLAIGSYTIQASYSGGTNFLASSGGGTLTVNPAPPPVQATTATTVSNSAATFSSGIQNVTLTAAVSGLNASGQPVTVNEGTVTFTVTGGAANLAVPSAALTNGNASVSYALPAGLAANAAGYTIQALFSGGTNFLASSGTATLVINQAQSATTFTSTAPASLPFSGTYTPAATSTGDGMLTIGASGACSIASGNVTITSGSGTCTVTATESQGNNFLGSSAPPQSITATDLVSIQTTPVTIASPGASGSSVVTLTPALAFTGTLSVSCATPAGMNEATCTPQRQNVNITSGAVVNVTVTITTTAPTVAGLRPGSGWANFGFMLGCPFLVGILRRKRWSGLLLMLVMLTAGFSACGGGSSRAMQDPGTARGMYSIMINASSGTTNVGSGIVTATVQ